MSSNTLLVVAWMAITLTAIVVAGHSHHSSHKHYQPTTAEIYQQLMNPDLFLQQEWMDDYHPIKLAPYQANETIYYSYHIHAYFLTSNVNMTAYATNLRNEFIATFDVPECGGECSTYCPNICHWDLNMQPRGPHPVGSWGIYVPLDMILPCMNFISMNHGDLSILVHPNSGYPIIDHSLNSLWIKQILPLDLSQLDPYDPPNSTRTW